jgi:mono/diheme cytochrome c family protein
MSKPRAVTLAALLLAGFRLSACGDQPGPAKREAVKAERTPGKAFVLGGDAAHGRSLFLSVCASCHGDQGDGHGEMAVALQPPPPDLRDPSRPQLDDEPLYRLIRDGGPAVGKSAAMMGVGGKLSDGEIRNVAAYVRKLSTATPSQPPSGHSRVKTLAAP